MVWAEMEMVRGGRRRPGMKGREKIKLEVEGRKRGEGGRKPSQVKRDKDERQEWEVGR